jgi:hypothetical protein
MRILFRCLFCFAECEARPGRDQGFISCKACGKQQALQYTESLRFHHTVDSCAVCRREDFYIRDDVRKLWGLLYLLVGLTAAYFTYGVSLALGIWGFYWHSWKYPKVTICYHCYAKYRNCRVNPKHGEYNLELVRTFEREIRDDRTFRDFRQLR